MLTIVQQLIVLCSLKSNMQVSQQLKVEKSKDLFLVDLFYHQTP